MNCAECEALATKLYEELREKLLGMANVKNFGTPEFQRLKKETLAARDESDRAKEALRILLRTI